MHGKGYVTLFAKTGLNQADTGFAFCYYFEFWTRANCYFIK